MKKEELYKKLKHAKIDKNKKWLYNFTASIIKMLDNGKDYTFIQNRINLYYKQHYESYFTKRHQMLPDEERRKKSIECYKRNVKNNAYRKDQYMKSLLLQMYNNGELSKKSTDYITKQITI